MLGGDGADGRRSDGRNAFFAERDRNIVDAVLPACSATTRRWAAMRWSTPARSVTASSSRRSSGDGRRVARALIAPGALVPPRKQLEGGALYAGSPAVRVRDVGRRSSLQPRRRSAAAPTGARARRRSARARQPWYAPAGFAGDGLALQAGRSPRFMEAWSAPTALVAAMSRFATDAGIYFACAVVAGGAAITTGAATNVQTTRSSLPTAPAAISDRQRRDDRSQRPDQCRRDWRRRADRHGATADGVVVKPAGASADAARPVGHGGALGPDLGGRPAKASPNPAGRAAGFARAAEVCPLHAGLLRGGLSRGGVRLCRGGRRDRRQRDLYAHRRAVCARGSAAAVCRRRRPSRCSIAACSS
jgi:carbonic anhydrase/acetyltransferase-like protein (isoleucine patch superfamily)